MKKIESYSEKDIKAINKELKHLKNGISYIETTKEECLNWGGYSICDRCLKQCNKGFLVWIGHSYLCNNCLQELGNLSLDSEDKELLKLEKDPTTYIWYLCHFDKDLSKEVKEINMKRFMNIK